jgi:hypothetical protein
MRAMHMLSSQPSPAQPKLMRPYFGLEHAEVALLETTLTPRSRLVKPAIKGELIRAHALGK